MNGLPAFEGVQCPAPVTAADPEQTQSRKTGGPPREHQLTSKTAAPTVVVFQCGHHPNQSSFQLAWSRDLIFLLHIAAVRLGPGGKD